MSSTVDIEQYHPRSSRNPGRPIISPLALASAALLVVNVVRVVAHGVLNDVRVNSSVDRVVLRI